MHGTDKAEAPFRDLKKKKSIEETETGTENKRGGNGLNVLVVVSSKCGWNIGMVKACT